MSREGFYWQSVSSCYTLSPSGAGGRRSETELLRSEKELLRKSKKFVVRKWRGRSEVFRGLSFRKGN